MQRVKADGIAGGAGHSVGRREHSRGIQDQQRVGEIAGPEDADAHQ